MKAFWGTIGFWCAVTMVSFIVAKSDRLMHAVAGPKEYVSTFDQQLKLSPGMFDGAMKGDREDLSWQGGALVDPKQTRALMFLKGAPGN